MPPKLVEILSLLAISVTFPPLLCTPLMSHNLSGSVCNSIFTTTYPSVSVILVMFLVSSTATPTWSPRHVDTKLGVVQGFVVHPSNFPGVEVLLNLPYASPPLGNLRFMPPTTPAPWSGVRRSPKPGPVCPQVLPDIRNETLALQNMPRGRLLQLQRLLPHLKEQSEDCLYLNLFVPVKVAEGRLQEKLPVLVFIHGDDYGYGAGSPYDPSILVSYGNIIVVTLNYRLGILGFLNANTDSHFRLPYNFALLDQIAALQWIQENVALFGGDRFNVTLMGHGKGAVLVNFLILSSALPTGLLFHRVILSSGSALSPLSSDLGGGPELSQRFARRVRCPPEPSSTMLECLREVPVRLFLESELWSLFGPTGDGIVVRNELPSDSVIMNKGSHYPLLFGVVRQESLPSLSNHDASYGMENERRRELLRQFINKHYRFHRNEILAGAIHEYTDWERPVQHPQNVREETLDALADASVVAPMTKVGDLHSQSSKSRAYFYVFDYQSKSSDYQQRLGCVHGEELAYIFGAPLFFYDPPTSSMMRPDISGDSSGVVGDYSAPISSSQSQLQTSSSLGLFTGNFSWVEVQLSLTVMRLWANFVRVGNPNEDPKPSLEPRYGWPSEKVGSDTGSHHHTRSFSPGDRSQTMASLPEPVLVDWPQYESLDKKYLVLDLRPRLKSHYRAHKLSFWLHLVPDYQKNDDMDISIPRIHHGLDFSNASSKHFKNESPNFEEIPTKNLDPPPTMFASGLYDKSGPHNASRSDPNSSKLSPGHLPEPKEPKPQQDSGVHPISSSPDNDSEPFAFSTYSTALSVTIAIGVSLFILNILIFATFYYEREKRLSAFRALSVTTTPRRTSSSSHSHAEQTHLQSSNSCCTSPRPQFHATPQTSRASNSSSLKRRKEPAELAKCSTSTYSSFYLDSCSGTANQPHFLQTSLARSYGTPCGESNPISEPAGAFDLHLVSYPPPDDSCAPSGDLNYGNYPIKRYSTSTLTRKSSQTSNEVDIEPEAEALSIDMSQSTTNEAHYSPQSSQIRGIPTFVGIEGYPGSSRSSFRHLLHTSGAHDGLGDNSNSSFEDAQSSTSLTFS